MSEYGDNANITGSLNVDGDIDLGSGDDDVNLDSNTLFVDADVNRVGIGTTSPDHELHVAGDIKAAGDDVRIKIDGDTDSHPGLEIYENGTRKWIVYNNYTNDNLTFKTNSDIRMSIEQDGNVGIGVANPDTQLEVFNAGTQLKLSYNGSDAATFAVDDNGYLTITPSGGLMATGMLGHKQYVGSALSNGATLTTSQSGILIPQTGNATPSSHVINLPATSPGITYTFWYAGTPGQGFHINPASGEKFMGNLLDKDGSAVVLGSNGVGRADKDLILGTDSDIGHFVTIVGSGSGFWMITNSQGDWSLES